MISAIVFSKDRPLQLHAYMESLVHYSGIDPSNIAVLTPVTSQFSSYAARHVTDENWEWPHKPLWFDDGPNFWRSLLLMLEDWLEGDLILWGCDDVVFKSPFSLQRIEDCFAKDPLLFDFSLRYGRNLLGWDKLLTDNKIWEADDVVAFNHGAAGVLGWEVSAAIYRKQDILQMLKMNITLRESFLAMYGSLVQQPVGARLHASQLIAGPNMLEAVIEHHYVAACPNLAIKQHTACFEFSKSVCLSVNRVQDVCPNVYDSRKDTQPEALYEAYLQDKRMNWRALEGWANRWTHEMSERFEVI